MNLARMRRSWEGWKKKAVARNQQLKAKKRQIKLLKSKVHAEYMRANEEATARLAAEARAVAAEKRLSALEAHPLLNMRIQINIRIISVMVFVMGVVSARAVPRIIQLFSRTWSIEIRRIPHHSSIINWICRAGIGKLKLVTQWHNRPWVAIIDTSISYAQQKLLVVLRAPLDQFSKNKRPLSLADVECIGVEIGETWNGNTVCSALTKIFSLAGAPAAILKDGGGDIGVGTKKWVQSQDGYIAIIRDIGHVIANELKHVYTRNQVLGDFLALVNSIRARLCQTELASLRPPTIRTKGRFQSISRVAQWAEHILLLIGRRGRAEKGSLRDRVRSLFKGLAAKSWLVRRLARDCIIANEFMELLKTRGLNQETYALARAIVMKFPKKSAIRKRLLEWLLKHIQIHCRLGIGQTPMLVSSDIIESLMGNIKMIVERNPLPEFGRLALAVPLLCGEESEDSVRRAIENCSHTELTKFLQEKVNNTIRKQKRKLHKELMPEDVPKTVLKQAG